MWGRASPADPHTMRFATSLVVLASVALAVIAAPAVPYVCCGPSDCVLMTVVGVRRRFRKSSTFGRPDVGPDLVDQRLRPGLRVPLRPRRRGARVRRRCDWVRRNSPPPQRRVRLRLGRAPNRPCVREQVRESPPAPASRNPCRGQAVRPRAPQAALWHIAFRLLGAGSFEVDRSELYERDGPVRGSERERHISMNTDLLNKGLSTLGKQRARLGSGHPHHMIS